MRARLATAVVTIALAIISITTQHFSVTADGVCPAGSNWDNSIHACH
jgi:hypothetical protein